MTTAWLDLDDEGTAIPAPGDDEEAEREDRLLAGFGLDLGGGGSFDPESTFLY